MLSVAFSSLRNVFKNLLFHAPLVLISMLLTTHRLIVNSLCSFAERQRFNVVSVKRSPPLFAVSIVHTADVMLLLVAITTLLSAMSAAEPSSAFQDIMTL
jgi:hypothetical protein